MIIQDVYYNFMYDLELLAMKNIFNLCAGII